MKRFIIGFLLGIVVSLNYYFLFAWINPISNPPQGGGLIQTQTGNFPLILTTSTIVSSGNFVIQNGNVGIGTTTPSFRLDINDSTDRQMRVYGPTTSMGGIQMGNYVTLQGHIELDNSYRRLLLAEGVYYDSTNNRYNLTNAPYDRAALEIINGGHITFKTESSNRSTPGYMTLTEWDSIERMRITNTGNVGIGTTAPNQKLHIYNGAIMTETCSGCYTLFVGKRVGDTYDRLNLAWNGLAFGGDGVTDVRPLYVGSTSGSDLSFYTANTERMRIDSSGNVGIGTTNPTQKLDVVGTVQATNVVKADGMEVAKIISNSVSYGSVVCDNTYHTLSSYTFSLSGTRTVNIQVKQAGRLNATGHSYIDMFIDDVRRDSSGVYVNANWRHFNITSWTGVLGPGSHTIRIDYYCGSGASSLADNVSEWPSGGLKYLIIVAQ